MKRKFFIGLLCLLVLMVPSLTKAAGSYIKVEDFSSAELAQLKVTTPATDMASALAEVEKTVGNVHMIKYVSTNGFIVLTFSEVNGFTENTYNSILSVLKHILSTKNYNHFVKNYSSISNENASFTGFRVRHVSERMNPESVSFDSTDKLLRVEICSNEFDDIPSSSTPTPTESPKPSSTPSPKPTPSATPSPKPTPDTEVTNPSTGDMNVVILGSIVAVAVVGTYLSLCKIREN